MLELQMFDIAPTRIHCGYFDSSGQTHVGPSDRPIYRAGALCDRRFELVIKKNFEEFSEIL